jgi:hypothetical protein
MLAMNVCSFLSLHGFPVAADFVISVGLFDEAVIDMKIYRESRRCGAAVPRR